MLPKFHFAFWETESSVDKKAFCARAVARDVRERNASLSLGPRSWSGVSLLGASPRRGLLCEAKPSQRPLKLDAFRPLGLWHVSMGLNVFPVVMKDT